MLMQINEGHPRIVAGTALAVRLDSVLATE
jgi:hypothetical protein